MLYTFTRFIRLFLELSTVKHPCVERGCWVVYLIVLLGVHLLYTMSVIIFVINISSLFIITLNYSASMRKRVMVVLISYLLVVVVELVSSLGVAKLNTNLFGLKEYTEIFLIVIMRIVIYVILVLILGNWLKAKRNITVSGVYESILVLILCSTIAILVLVFQALGLGKERAIGSVILVTIINLAVLYFYNQAIEVDKVEIEKKRLFQQNQYYDVQLHLMEI